MYLFGIKNLVAQKLLVYVAKPLESKLYVGWLDEKTALNEENVCLFSLEWPLDVLRAQEKEVIAHVLNITFPDGHRELDMEACNLTLIPYLKEQAPGRAVVKISRELH